MSLKDKLQTSMKEAMKAKDKIRLDAIRTILSALQYEEIEKKVEPLPDEAVVGLLQREVKKRKEEIEFAEKAGRAELIEKFKVELSVIESFLPKQLSAQELEKIVGDLKSANPGSNMGVIMKALKDSFSGQYDGKLASEIVKKVVG